MKICVLSDGLPFSGGGGAERIAWELASSYRVRGHTVIAITTTPDRAQAGEAEREGVRVHTLYSKYDGRWRAWRSLYNPQTVPELIRLLKDFGPDVVHAHNIHAHLSYASLRAAHLAGARVFLTAHDVMLFHYGKLMGLSPTHPDYRVSPWKQLREYRWRYNPLRNFFIRHALKHVTRIIAVSEALKDALSQNGITNVSVIHNGIDVSAWSVEQDVLAAFKAKYSLGSSVILYGGRLSEAKGGGVILDAFKRLKERTPFAQLLVMGSKDGYANRLLKESEDDKIIFTGYLAGDQLRSAYHAATVVAVPSLCFDSFPTTILEAMACSKPVVATCFGGSREAVVEGVTGNIVDPRDTAALAKALELYLHNAERAQHVGAKGRERTQTELALTRQTDQYLKLFTDVA